jgi:Fic family protein
MRTKIISSAYLEYYKKKQPITIHKHFNKIKEEPMNSQTFGYHLSVASVFSSMIEGNPIDIDSFLRYDTSGMNTKSKSFKEIQDLIAGYSFAASHSLDRKNVLKAHNLLTNHIIEDENYRGKLRDRNVFVYGGGVKIYEGAESNLLEQEMINFFDDIKILLHREMTFNEVFYFASMIHLVFVKIHPFADGNGRTARLIEKWFLAEKLGKKAWCVDTEKMYQKRLKSYYKNLDIGPTYSNMSYDLCLPFLLMLPMSLTTRY